MLEQYKQPKGFNVFCLTEMWERYGFYIIQFTLTLVLASTYHLGDKQVYALSGSFMALVYFSPIIGGYLADKILGYRHGVLLGLVSLTIGYSMMASHDAGLWHLYLSLSMIALGTGLVKANITAFLGGQYHDNKKTGEQDVRRHKGFTIFYAVLNAGEVLAGFTSGYLAPYLGGWHGLNVTAAVGLLIGVAIFHFGLRYYGIKEQREKKPHHQIIIAYIACALFMGMSAVVLESPTLAWYALWVAAIVAVLAGFIKAINLTSMERKKLFGFYLLSASSTVFWGMYFLIYSALTLYIKRVVDHHFIGITIPVPFYGAIESLAVVILGFVLGAIWLRLKQSGRDLSTPGKFTLGFTCMTAMMGILYVSTLAAHSGKISSGWLISAYTVLAVGELSLSAIGLAMVNELVPKETKGTMMGVWFVCLGIGGKLSTLLGDQAAIPKNIHSMAKMKHIYDHAFLTYFVIALIATAVSFALTIYVKRLIQPNR